MTVFRLRELDEGVANWFRSEGDRNGQLGFFDLDERYRGLDAKKDPLVVLNAVVPWEDFRAQLSAVWRKPDEERDRPPLGGPV